MILDTEPIQLWWSTAGVLLAMLAVFLVARGLDDRQLEGDNVWAKPSKFALSLALHFATLALLGGWTDSAALVGPTAKAAAWLVIGATAFEMIYIAIQAARQQRSHFNLATPVLRLLYAAMALGAVVITLAAGWIGILLVIDGSRAPGPASLLGAQLGLLGGTVLTLVTAFRIGSTLERFVGRMPLTHVRMPLTGWSLNMGDRRVAHFLATHMMQSLPILGLIVDAILPGPLAIAIIWAGAVGNVVLVVGAHRTAESGRPFIALARARV